MAHIVVIRNVVLFDGRTTHQHATVVFDSHTGLITSVQAGSSSSADGPEYPAGATVIDGRGCHTLLPGLIDCHIHCHRMHLPAGADGTAILTDPLTCGVTTVCDMHSDPETVWDLQQRERDEVRRARSGSSSSEAAGEEGGEAAEAGQGRRPAAGTVTMSSLKSSHYAATIEGGWPKPVVLGGEHGTEEVRAHVATWPSVTVETAAEFVAGHRRDGADYIKLMQENCRSLAMPTGSIPVATPELQAAVVRAAHEHGFICVGHATAIESTELILDAGADGLTHTFIDQAPTDSVLRRYQETGAFVIPTLVILSSLTGEEQELRDRFAAVAASRPRFLLDPAKRENYIGSLAAMRAEDATVQHAYDTVRRLRAAGVDVAAGTDSALGLRGTCAGISLWHELAMYVDRCGFSPEEALRSATEVAARRMGFGDRGTVEVGKRADLVLVAGGDATRRLDRLWEGEGVVRVWKEGLALG